MPIPTRLKQIAVKVEAVEGVAEALAAVDAGFNIFGDPAFQSDVEQFPQVPFEASLGSRVSIAGVRPGRISFETQMVGSGNHLTTEPPWAPALKACGFEAINGLESITIGAITGGPFRIGETVTGGTSAATAKVARVTKTGTTILYLYSRTGTFVSGELLTGGTSAATATTGSAITDRGWYYRPKSDPSSVTLGIYSGGLRNRIVGARGNVTFKAETTGAPFMMGFEFLGAALDPDDVALLTGVVYPSLSPPKFMNVGLVAQGFAVVADSIELTMGNELEMRRSVNTTTGLIAAALKSRAAGGRIDPEAELVATHDFYGKLFNNLTDSLEFTIGTQPGNTFIIHAPAAQYTQLGSGERAGKWVFNTELTLTKVLGDDELVILAV